MTEDERIDARGGPDPQAGIPPEGFRAPPETHVGRVRLQVADLDRSLTFYGDLLGFDVLEQTGNVAVLGARAKRRPPAKEAGEAGAARGSDDARAPLVELVERRGARAVPPRGRLGLFHVAILLPDRTALGRILVRLAGEGLRVGSADHLVSEALYLTDPDGLGLEIYADRPRGDWRSNGREIAMATEPLDLHGLTRAGGGVPWDGMPPGTRVGHIHLSVGTLAQAEAFFHAGLGLDKIVWSYPGALFLSAGGYHHHVGANVWARAAVPASEDDARLLEWRLVYPSEDAVAAALQSVADAGFATGVDRRDRSVTDPWGTRVRLATDG